MEIVPKVSLEHVVRVAAAASRDYLITQEVLRVVDHKPEDRDWLKRKIERILRKENL